MEFEAFYNSIHEHVEKGEWKLIGVFGTEESPSFTYTIGLLQNFGHPEVIVIGLPYQTAGVILNMVGDAIRKGQIFEPDKHYDELANLPTAFVPVLTENMRVLNQAIEYYKWRDFQSPIQAIQMVWPDPNKKFPWDEGFHPEYRVAQPLLNQVDEQTRRFLND